MKRLFAAMLLAALAPAACAALPDCLAVRAADPVAGRRCLQGEAENGEPAAMFLLAHMLAEGEGGTRDAAAARAWLERAAALDYPEALQELALAEPDPQRADALMRMAAHALAHRAHAAAGH
jgi:TPR repeat protein